MSIMLPGIVSVFTSGTPVQDVLVPAAVDVVVVAVLVASVAVLSSALEHLFKFLVDNVTGSSRMSYLLESYLTYPGVVYHELSHALFGFLSGAKVDSISLRRRDNPDGSVTLGSVQLLVSTNPLLGSLQLTLSGIAPSVMGLVGMSLIFLFAFPSCTTWWMWVLWIYAFVCVLLHSEMSRRDLRSAGSGVPIIALVLFAVFLVFPVDVGALFHMLFG